MIDTHCHINDEAFLSDIDQVIKDAFYKGVKPIVVIGFDDTTNKRAIELVNQYEGLYATVGIHPSDAHDGQVSSIEPLLSHPKVVAVGECGLDFYWQDDNKEEQIDVFKKQIELSIKYNLPLVIHTRNSFKEAYECLLPYKGQAQGVFHCFSSHLEDALKAIDLGFFVGLDGPVTFKNGKDAIEIAKHIPLEWLVVETDSPYLAPTPYRGKRNEPQYLTYIVETIAHLRGISVDEVIKQTTANAKKLYHIEDDV